MNSESAISLELKDNAERGGFPLERKLVLVLPFSSVPSSLLTSNSDVFESALNIASTPEKIE